MTTFVDSPIRPSFIDLLKQPVLLLAFGFGSGLAPRAPGTAGTLVGMVIHWLLVPMSTTAHMATLVLVAALGIPVCGSAARRLGVHDHPGIVWDEIAGYLLTMLFAPSGWTWMLAGFGMFRLFDILKPWPIRWLDRNVHGGLGIMLDDLAAGLAAGLVLYGFQVAAVAVQLQPQ